MATCPRCGARFQFRKLEKPSETPAPAPAQAPQEESPLPEPQPVERTADAAAAGAVSDDPLPPGAVVPEVESFETARDDGEKAEAEQDESPAQESPRGNLRRENARDALDVPWEEPAKYGLIGGLYQTILRVLFQPARFFAALPAYRGRLVRPVAFYLILGILQTLIKLLWMQNALAPAMTDPRVQEMLSATSLNIGLALLSTPAILLVQLYFYAVLFFFMLRLVQPEKVAFPTVLRVIAYSAAPLVVSIVPLVGPVAAMVWFAASCFIGCRFALDISWPKVALALCPLYAIAFAISMQLMMQLAALG